MSINDDAAVGQYRLHASFEPSVGRKVFIAAVEDNEGCGEIHISVHATFEGATQSLREMVEYEFGRYEEFSDNYNSNMTVAEIEELVSDEVGKTAKVEEYEVLA